VITLWLPEPMTTDRNDRPIAGLAAIRPLLADAYALGEWRLLPTSANRMPAAASYLRRTGDSEFRAFKFDVPRISNGMTAEITTSGADLFPAFGLQPTLKGES
jgi:hypothetical protein